MSSKSYFLGFKVVTPEMTEKSILYHHQIAVPERTDKKVYAKMRGKMFCFQFFFLFSILRAVPYEVKSADSHLRQLNSRYQGSLFTIIQHKVV